jgi:hypothetical protein
MAIFVETIGTTSFEVYGGVTACTAYLLGSASAGATAFRALATADDQVRRLVDASRYIDEQYWQGVATALAGGTPTTLQFPRTGLTDVAGQPLDATNVPGVVVTAAFEMAAILAGDPDAAAAADQGSNVSSLGAGPARIAFFRPTSPADGNATVLPTVVDRLIGRWRAGARAAASGMATGINPVSNFRSASCSWCSSSPCSCSNQRPDRTWPL